MCRLSRAAMQVAHKVKKRHLKSTYSCQLGKRYIYNLIRYVRFRGHTDVARNFPTSLQQYRCMSFPELVLVSGSSWHVKMAECQGEDGLSTVERYPTEMPYVMSLYRFLDVATLLSFSRSRSTHGPVSKRRRVPPLLESPPFLLANDNRNHSGD